MFKRLVIVLWVLGLSSALPAQEVSKVWVSDLGNGNYKNPVLHADYSDPDVCQAGEDYYMTSSSFNAVPGLPILHSSDLVNWKLISYALPLQPPLEHFSKVQHGNGVWAPSIRYHNNEFLIYYPDPDFGIYLTRAKDPKGPWSEPVLVEGGKGLIDPCPLWDDDGKVYLVHAYAGSRASIKSVIVVKELNPEGTKVVNEGKIVYDGHGIDGTIEGPKFYKKDGYYYIFAPAGGVSTGWQVVLRSKNIYGPYERRNVMEQGSTPINGPHQGAWVSTSSGEDWFIHFQDKEAYGRVVHLNPMVWEDGWPVIGLDKNKDGTGEPVLEYKKPDLKSSSVMTPPETDEFNDLSMGLQWQWHANPKAYWSFMNTAEGKLRLYSQMIPDSLPNYWEVPNLLLQKFPAPEFQVTTRLDFHPNPDISNEKSGLILMGETYASLAIQSLQGGELQLVFTHCTNARKGNKESVEVITKLKSARIYLRMMVHDGGVCKFSYSTDGKKYKQIDIEVKAQPGRWIGAKTGLFCTRTQKINDSGYADFDWFRVEPLSK